jgi:malonyl-CoA O-methyltransferase
MTYGALAGHCRQQCLELKGGLEKRFKHRVNIRAGRPAFTFPLLMATNQRPPTLDPIAVARWQRVAPAASPWLHEEVASRMQDRLQWIKLLPAAWAHWGAVRGGLKAHAELVKKYPKSECFLAETQSIRAWEAIKKIAVPGWSPTRWIRKTLRFELPPPASVEMLWANMALHEAADPQALLADWHSALKVNGFLMFSCLGPDTAIELREVYRQLGWPPAGHDLTDMHDWGDMLVQAGFAEPVMDMERITLTYDSPARLRQELAELGRNFHPARFPALRGRRWRARLEAMMAERLTGADGRLSLTFEVIYGHALKAQPKIRVSALSSVSVEDMRSIMRSMLKAPLPPNKAPNKAP